MPFAMLTLLVMYIYVGTPEDEEVEPGWCYKLQKSL